MNVAKYQQNKKVVTYCTENGTQIVKLTTTKTDNAVFYRGTSVKKAKQMFSDLVNKIENNVI